MSFKCGLSDVHVSFVFDNFYVLLYFFPFLLLDGVSEGGNGNGVRFHVLFV